MRKVNSKVDSKVNKPKSGNKKNKRSVPNVMLSIMLTLGMLFVLTFAAWLLVRNEGTSLPGSALFNSLKGSGDSGITAASDSGSAGNATITGVNADSPSMPLVYADPGAIPEYAGSISIELSDDKPAFTLADVEQIVEEQYEGLDELGRCRGASARLTEILMPREDRPSIDPQIRPSGWHQAKYPGIVDSDPPYLYNRCHLIAYALTGQTDNPDNLITGTRAFNIEGMLPYEMQVINYLRDEPRGSVLYRVTPYYVGDELLARGVEMEALSLYDDGSGVCFHVFAYNVQPGIDIDYSTGKNALQR